MTTYKLPPEPAGPVWITDRAGRVKQAVRHGHEWLSDGVVYTWTGLLDSGIVTDEDPNPLSETPTPWRLEQGTGIVDALGRLVISRLTVNGEQEPIQRFIVDAVNEHAFFLHLPQRTSPAEDEQ